MCIKPVEGSDLMQTGYMYDEMWVHVWNKMKISNEGDKLRSNFNLIHNLVSVHVI